jgi:hypothetical protein
MYALLEKIDAIEAKAKELLIKWNTLKQENEVLARENELLKIELKQHKDKIEELTLSQFADIKQSDNNSIAIRQEIRRLIEEVDECIKLTQNI